MAIELTTKQLAERVGKSERYVRRVMAKMERMRLVVRNGERGGWTLSTQPAIALAKRGGQAAGGAGGGAAGGAAGGAGGRAAGGPGGAAASQDFAGDIWWT